MYRVSDSFFWRETWAVVSSVTLRGLVYTIYIIIIFRDHFYRILDLKRRKKFVLLAVRSSFTHVGIDLV